MKFLLWLLFFSFLVILPTKYWKKLYLFLKKYSFREGRDLREGQKLWQEILNREIQGGGNSKIDPEHSLSLPKYKFYHSLAQEMMNLERSLGASCSVYWQKIRSWLGIDLSFERQIQERLMGTFIQFAGLAFISHFFIIISHSYLNLEIYWKYLLLALCWQLLGLLLFLYLVFKLQLSSFQSLHMAIKYMILFSVLLKGRLSIGQVLKRAKLFLIFEDSDKKLTVIKKRLPQLLDAWKGRGRPIDKEIEHLIELSWSLNKSQLTLFIKKMEGLKFLISVLFFLSTYFALISASFSGFFIE